MKPISDEELHAHFCELQSTMPQIAELRALNETSTRWRGRAQALIKIWDPAKSIFFNQIIDQLRLNSSAFDSYQRIATIIEEAIFDLSINLPRKLGVVTRANEPFTYHRAMCEILKTAKKLIFIVDPYLNPSFLADYMPFIPSDVVVRLLASEYFSELVVSVRKYAEQANCQIEVRNAKGRIHERWIYIDNNTGYLSGPSLKDGGGTKYSTIIPTPSFPLTMKINEEIWNETI